MAQSAKTLLVKGISLVKIQKTVLERYGCESLEIITTITTPEAFKAVGKIAQVDFTKVPEFYGEPVTAT